MKRTIVKYTDSEIEMILAMDAQGKDIKEIVEACKNIHNAERNAGAVLSRLNFIKKNGRAEKKVKEPSEKKSTAPVPTTSKSKFGWVKFDMKHKDLVEVGSTVEFNYGIVEFTPMIGNVTRIEDKGVHITCEEGSYCATWDKVNAIKLVRV